MSAGSEDPSNILQALKRVGLGEDRLENLGPESQIVTDLAIWGDDFSGFRQILSELYGTEFLVRAECIRSEFAWTRTLRGWLLFSDKKKAVPAVSLTVRELDEIMFGLEPHGSVKPRVGAGSR